MKKVFIAMMAILMAWSFGKVNAQEEFKPFRFGLHASPSISWIKPDTKGYENDGTRLGFGYGVLAEFNLSNNYSLATGLDIVYQGGKLVYDNKIKYDEDTVYSNLVNRKFKLQYLQVPFMMKMSTNEIGYITYYANVGLGLGVRLNANSNDELADGKEVNDHEISDDVRLLKASFIIGFGAEYSIAKNISLVGNINFNNGFTDILKEKNKITNKEENAIANYVELKIGLLF